MYCPKCGAQLPDDATYCMKCGTNVKEAVEKNAKAAEDVLAPTEAKALKCPSCGAPINPQFGEMVITCAYCGTTITLGNAGWKNIAKQTMLPISLSTSDQVVTRVRGLMDVGILHRHLLEESKLEEMNLSLVPYWIVSASATTSIVASDVAVEAGQVATTAALIGLMGAAMGGGRGRGFGLGGPLIAGTMIGTTMGGRGGARKSFEIADNYNFPIVAMKALASTQPRDYQFRLEERAFFDLAKVPKDVKVLNGDIGEEVARSQTKALVAQLQSLKAHSQYHMIQQLHTEVEVGEAELLHAPIWFARYDHEGTKIAFMIDANSGGVINSLGL